jgi:hypothetical protein
MGTEICSESLKPKDYLEDIGVDGRIIIVEWVLEKWGDKMWTGFVCLRIGTIGWLL